VATLQLADLAEAQALERAMKRKKNPQLALELLRCRSAHESLRTGSVSKLPFLRETQSKIPDSDRRPE